MSSQIQLLFMAIGSVPSVLPDSGSFCHPFVENKGPFSNRVVVRKDQEGGCCK